MNRRAEFRPFSWLNDLARRDQLDLDPPYQRRSVWSDRYKAEFVTTVLLNYPCPAVFLYEEIRPDGSFIYKVVDGKQRITTLLEFADSNIAIAEDFPITSLRGRVFADLDDERKLQVWRYSFAVEFIEQENETIINDIFNRINKNVARLSPQELRHARFSGIFAATVDRLTEVMEGKLPAGFPRIASQSKRQMKDVENVAVLLMFCEQGERSLSQLDIDVAYSRREEDWEREAEVTAEFVAATDLLGQVLQGSLGSTLYSSRLRNQADFYSLFAAIVEMQRQSALPPVATIQERLVAWVTSLPQGDAVEGQEADAAYLTAARSASNDPTPRRVRIDRVKAVISGS